MEQANGLRADDGVFSSRQKRVVSDRRMPVSPARIEARFKRNAAFPLLKGELGEGGIELLPGDARWRGNILPLYPSKGWAIFVLNLRKKIEI